MKKSEEFISSFEIHRKTPHFKRTKPEGESAEESKVEAKSSNTPDETLMEHTIVNVATVQGWLKDGPNGELRWQLALLRPPVEFPSMNPAY